MTGFKVHDFPSVENTDFESHHFPGCVATLNLVSISFPARKTNVKCYMLTSTARDYSLRQKSNQKLLPVTPVECLRQKSNQKLLPVTPVE